MHTKPYQIYSCVFTAFLVSSATAEGLSLQELQQRCEQAREAKIAPLRQEAIEECIARESRRRDVQAYCERFYSDFGQGGRTASGHFQQPMFNDLPECQAFHEAERQSQESSRSR